MKNLHIVDGGIGKHIQFTALIEPLHKKYNQRLAINSAWPFVFGNHPLVAVSKPIWNDNDILYHTTQTYYSKFDNIIKHDPYFSNWSKGGCHVSEQWAEMYGVEITDTRPDFYIDPKREQILKPEIEKLGKYIVVQFTGGQGKKGATGHTDWSDNNFGRNYTQGQEVVNLLKELMPGLNILHWGHDNELDALSNTIDIRHYNRNEIGIFIKHCSSFIVTDSSLSQIVANRHWNKKGLILYGTTSPQMFGYKHLNNIITDYEGVCDINPQKIIDEIIGIDL